MGAPQRSADPAPRGEAPHVVIVGGGFAGLYAARALRGAPVRLTLVDQHNYHVFQPLLYQVATAALAAPDISAPIRKVLRSQSNATVLFGSARGVDPAGRRVLLADGELGYDLLVLATGMVNDYFGHAEWTRHAPGLKDFEDALEIRRRILLAYEAAEREADEERRARLLTFAVIGGGPTGVELAGALAEIARETLARDFRRFDARDSRIVLVEAGPRLLPAFDEVLAAEARRRLEGMGVQVRTGTRVVGVDEQGIDLELPEPALAAPSAAPVPAEAPAGGALAPPRRRLLAATVVWAAGVRAQGIGQSLGVPLDRGGRVLVEPDLSVPGHPEIFVAGDLASLAGPGGRPLPALAPVAIQMGRHVARQIRRRLAGQTTEPFRYRDRGLLATIGRSSAIAQFGKLRISGTPAWLLWAFVHVAFLIGFRNRLAVMFEWAWLWVSRQRSARVILEEAPPDRPR